MISAMNTLAVARSSHLPDQVAAIILVDSALKWKQKYRCVNLAARIASGLRHTSKQHKDAANES